MCNWSSKKEKRESWLKNIWINTGWKLLELSKNHQLTGQDIQINAGRINSKKTVPRH